MFVYIFNIIIYLIVLIQEITKIEIRISFTKNFDMKTRNYQR
jgi:small neutral amino acid transporter SnatA (MarC family)